MTEIPPVARNLHAAIVAAVEAFWRTHNRGEFPVEQVCYVHWFARVEQEADAR